MKSFSPALRGSRKYKNIVILMLSIKPVIHNNSAEILLCFFFILFLLEDGDLYFVIFNWFLNLLQDMTSRDLLQQRTTLPNGDTVWRPSPLVTAALEGSMAILDGVHRINQGSFSVLHRCAILINACCGLLCWLHVVSCG